MTYAAEVRDGCSGVSLVLVASGDGAIARAEKAGVALFKIPREFSSLWKIHFRRYAPVVNHRKDEIFCGISFDNTK